MTKGFTEFTLHLDLVLEWVEAVVEAEVGVEAEAEVGAEAEVNFLMMLFF